MSSMEKIGVAILMVALISVVTATMYFGVV